MYITYLLLVVTLAVSVKAFSDSEFMRKCLWNPYLAVHHKEWYRAFTHGFIHKDWMHLGFNMFALYIFGEGLEEYFIFVYGAKGYMYFGILYLGAILFATTISLQRHKDNPGYNSLGASGAVYAVVFACILIDPTMKLTLLILPIPGIPAYIFGPLLLVGEYFMDKRGNSAIGHDAHISGAIFGLVFMAFVDGHLYLDFIEKIS